MLHHAVTVTGLTGQRATFPACNSKIRHFTLAMDRTQVTCKRCLKGIKPEYLTTEQRALLGNSTER